ncbi:Ger(x)C family spore germination protein [Halalkalibacter alkaliphilus]|uniref:Ger(X)C family spore germination protein n=1 Tax=Halalkalibacter alkaliphilus TaxID=2917993 RepID=A0A9X2CSZ5_9BACI|nr:Ger(x)C family spore germination protein [Halalkalibacter alkaliphilus]MCL7747703.1 Ger(x)C family spore germination protein [Halalkalibacter alkaliphilus]
MNGKVLTFLLICLLILPGCWDLTEIEQISFVIGTAFDPMNDEEIRATYEEETGRPLPKGMFQMTNQIVIPGQIEGGEEGGSASEGPFFNIRTTAMTSFKTNRNFTTRRSRTMNYEHLKTLIINEELAREGIIEHLLDLFIRDHEMRRDILILISKGKGSDILEKKLPLEMMPAMSIEMISEHAPRGHSIPPPKYSGELMSNIISDQSYIIPRIVNTDGEEFKVAGAAVFLGKENKMVGWMGEYDVQGYSWITGTVENEIVEAYYGREQKPFVYETDYTETEVHYKKENGKDIFDIKIRSEGFFVENWIAGIELDSQETILKLEEEVAKEIERQGNKIIGKMQEEFFTDIFQLHEHVKTNNFSYWQEVKGHWDGEGGAFSNTEINVEAKVKIRHHMTTEELEEE